MTEGGRRSREGGSRQPLRHPYNLIPTSQPSQRVMYTLGTSLLTSVVVSVPVTVSHLHRYSGQ